MRKIKQQEINLLKFLLSYTLEKIDFLEKIKNANVIDLNDGGMGSIRFLYSNDDLHSIRKFGREVVVVMFHDIDNIEISVAFNADQFEMPFEIDIWKTDFSPTIHYPDSTTYLYVCESKRF